MLNVLKATGMSLLIKVLSVVAIVGVFSLQAIKINHQEAVIAKQDGQLLRYQDVYKTHMTTIEDLQLQLEKSEQIALKRQTYANSIVVEVAQEKAQIDNQLRNSDDENDIAWADAQLPVDVVRLFNDTRGGGEDQVGTTAATNDFAQRMHRADINGQYQPSPG